MVSINNLEDLDSLLSSHPKPVKGFEKSFYPSLAKNFNSILTFISSQEDFALSEPAVQEQICAFVIESNYFIHHQEPLKIHLINCACTIFPDNDLYGCLWLIYRILALIVLRSGISPVFGLTERKTLVPKLFRELREPLDGLLEFPALLLLTEIFKSSSLSSHELKSIGDSDLSFLFSLSEHSRNNNEAFSYAVNHFLLCIHHQTLDTCPEVLDPFSNYNELCRFRKKLPVSNSDDPFCDSEATHDLIGLVRCSPVLRFLQNNFHTAKTFGEDLVFMLNREGTRTNICSILDFFTDLFNHPLTSEYLYTNDLAVLVDIIIRELCDLDDSLDQLRYSFICTLTSLICFSQYQKSPHKLEEIHRLLKHITQNPSGVLTEFSSQFFSQAADLLASLSP